MIVATWNINGIRARLDYILDWLETRQPDIVGLQELKAEEGNFPFEAFENAGYHAIIHGQKAWNGVAVLSKEPGEMLQAGLPGTAPTGSRMLAVNVSGIDFVSLYCPNGKSIDHPDFHTKLAWFDHLVEFLEATDRIDPERSVMVGDFNICPEPVDSWSEELLAGTIFHTAEERDRINRLKRIGFKDLFRALNPEARVFSWWDYRGGAFYKNQGLRIDLLLASETIAARAVEVFTDRDFRKKREGLTPSDHAPVIAVLK